jgi:ABC-type uncharacterized transport system ATPase subunit
MGDDISSDNGIVICMRDISVVYGDFAALYEINLDIKKGDFIGIHCMGKRLLILFQFILGFE